MPSNPPKKSTQGWYTVSVDTLRGAVVVAAFIVFLGDKLGVGNQLAIGVVVVLGVRIFSNVASIRRHLFNA